MSLRYQASPPTFCCFHGRVYVVLLCTSPRPIAFMIPLQSPQSWGIDDLRYREQLQLLVNRSCSRPWMIGVRHCERWMPCMRPEFGRLMSEELMLHFSGDVISRSRDSKVYCPSVSVYCKWRGSRRSKEVSWGGGRGQNGEKCGKIEREQLQ